jgi:hypothetical protein|nr:hypothetical protein [Kofleriaceae bacterium]
MTTRVLLFATVAAVACGDTTDTTPFSLNFDRPVDVGFACYGGLRVTGGGSSTLSQPVITSAMPTTACDIRSQQFDTSQPAPTPPGQEDLTGSGGSGLTRVSWYGFALDSEPGTVTVMQWDPKPSNAFVGGDITTLDTDPLTPGTNGITIGDNPVAIATSKDGCYEVSANAGTCDMSALDITSALTLSPPARVDQLEVTNSAGVPIRAKPTALIGEPAGGIIGQACGAKPVGKVFVAYPSCHLVAQVDLSTGQIVQGVSFASGAPVLVDGSVTCPDECVPDDGSAGSSTVAVTPGIRPVALDLFDDTRVNTRRLAIGADNSPTLTVVELDDTTSAMTSVSQIALEDDTLDHSLGITAVAMSPQIGMGGSGGVIVDAGHPQFQFVYGVATDGTVHVADILNVRKECDTQVDPRLVNSDTDISQMSCFPVGDPATPRRRVGVTGPGIRLPFGNKPLSVAIFEGLSYEGDSRSAPNDDPSTMIGYFALVSGSTGTSFYVNVNDDYYGDTFNPAPNQTFVTQMPLALPHQLRDDVIDRNELDLQPYACDSAGPDPDSGTGISASPRAPSPPLITPPATGQVSVAKSVELPSIHQEFCGAGGSTPAPVSDLEWSAPDRDNGITYPDLLSLGSDETWSVIWEGTLSEDSSTLAIDGPIVRTGELEVQNSSGMDLVDQTAPFCDAGVEPYDIVQLRGCDPALGNLDCPLGDVCFVHPDSTVVGLGACMAADEASRLADACKEYLVSLRRYSVGHSASGDLLLIPRRHNLITSPVDGCTDDAQCKSLADYQVRLADSLNPIDDTTGSDSHTYACLADPSRAPIGGTGKSCTQTCTSDADCDAGIVCDGGMCVEGVVPPQSCVNSPQRYDLRAGAAFAVVGTLSGYVHPIIADSGGNCVVDPKAHPFQVGRIPLNPPACDPAADPLTGLKPDGTYDANPCLDTKVGQAEFPQTFDANCNETNGTATVVTTNGVRFHGPAMTFTMVDPTYSGDSKCIGDGSGTLQGVPMVPDGYEVSFRVVGGFNPLVPPIDPAVPVKVLRGPTESLWVIDEGDFISTSLTEDTTKGKVFRVESVAPAVINDME